MSSSSNKSNDSQKPKKKHPLQHLIAGGCAGLVESSICHPLDTIKTRYVVVVVVSGHNHAYVCLVEFHKVCAPLTHIRYYVLLFISRLFRHASYFVSSMQLRRQGTSVAKSVVKMRDSLMEPALRLKHSLQEPTLKAAAATTGLHEPSLHLKPAGAVPSATVTIKAPGHHVVQATLGPIGTARRIVQREGFFALYKGLTAVYTGIIPKMAIRFVSFEQFRELGIAWNGGQPSTTVTFTAGLLSGLTEAILVVTPAEVSLII